MTPSGSPWRVSYLNSDVLRERLQRWEDEAVELGIGPVFQEAITTVRLSLSTDPVAFGDRQYDARAARYTVYQRAIRPLVITYAVHVEARVVWVRDIRPFPGSGLSED